MPYQERRLALWLVLGCAVGWAVVLANTQSWNFLYADDALPFVVRVFQGQTHPHHLVLGVLARVNAALGWVEPGEFGKTLGLMRAYVAVMSVLGVAALGYLAWQWFGRWWAVGTAIAVMVLSYGYWAYSVVPDFYVPGIAAILGAGGALERLQHTGRRWWLMGVVLGIWLATLNHQSYAVFAVIATVVLLANKHPTEAILTASLSFTLLAGTYLLAFLSQQEYRSFWGFIAGYAGHMQFTPYDRLQLLTPLYALVGLVRAWTFPEYFLRLDSVSNWVEQRWSMKLFLDERFLLRHLEPFIAAVLGIFGLLAVLLLAGVFFRRYGEVHRQLRQRWSYWTIIGWACAMAALAILWEPSSNEFWLWVPPVVALLVSGIQEKTQRWAIGVAGGFLLVSTAPVIWLYRSPENDVYSVNKRYRLRLSAEDVLITGDFHQVLALNWLYPTRARTVQFDLGRLEWDSPVLQQALRQLAHPQARGRLVLDPLIVMPHPSESALRRKIPRYTEEHVEHVLQQIAQFCSSGDGTRRRIPLFGVRRDGGGVVKFRVRQVPGMEWVEQ